MGVGTDRGARIMRYEKADNLLQLALEMQASRVGLSLTDIEQRFDVGRRTAMRMRDAILRNFPQAEEVPTDERTKRWRLPAGLLDRLVSFSADDLAHLETAIQLLRRENLEDQADSLAETRAKLTALMRPEHIRKVEPDVEALLEAEGLALRPGPKPRLRVLVLEDLRSAIKGCQQVILHYRNRKGTVNQRLVHPYGFLYGHRHYLVGFHVHKKANDYTLFSLPNIEKVEVLPDSFERDEAFDIQAFADRSFGLFQEEPFEVVWKFTAEAARAAKDFVFHPSQRFEEKKDGTLIVRFRAGSDMEMAWHLYRWGDQVEVLEPEHLAEMVNGSRRSWPGLP